MDPTFNKGVMIEIFDNKNKAKKKEKVSLADMCKQKKKEGGHHKLDNR